MYILVSWWYTLNTVTTEVNSDGGKSCQQNCHKIVSDVPCLRLGSEEDIFTATTALPNLTPKQRTSASAFDVHVLLCHSINENDVPILRKFQTDTNSWGENIQWQGRGLSGAFS